MSRNEQAVRAGDLADHPLRTLGGHLRETEPRTIVIRHGSG